MLEELDETGIEPGFEHTPVNEVICFGETLRNLPNAGIVTEGPHRADAIAAGYLFETDMANGAYAIVSEQLAPEGATPIL